MSQPLKTKEGNTISFAREQRLITIDKLLAKQGHLNREDIIAKHRIGTATATADIKLYNSLAPAVTAVYSHVNKRYERTDQFTPLFPDEVKYVK